MVAGKRAPHRLRLVPETLRTLSSADIDRAVGGIGGPASLPTSKYCTFTACNPGGGQ